MDREDEGECYVGEVECEIGLIVAYVRCEVVCEFGLCCSGDDYADED